MEKADRSAWMRWIIMGVIQVILTVGSVSFVIGTYGSNQKANSEAIKANTETIANASELVQKVDLRTTRINAELAATKEEVLRVERSQEKDMQDIKERLDLIIHFLEKK